MAHRGIAASAILCFALSGAAQATVQVDRVLFSDGMVLQRQMPVPVWGTAEPGETVTVSFGSQTKSTAAGTRRTWAVQLDAMEAAAEPADLVISGTNTVQIHEVRVGEVWLCSGQSNMAIGSVPVTLRWQYPEIYTLTEHGWHDRPTPTCFWLGANLYTALQVPIGLINRAVAGTTIYDWLGPTAAADVDPQVQVLIRRRGPFWGKLYRSKILPLEPYAIRGIAWWQGEADINTPDAYRHLLPALIRSWRREWTEGDFPFFFVQVPTGGGLTGIESPRPLPPVPPAGTKAGHCPPMRDAYIEALSQPHTGMVISTDLNGGLHPRDKQDYGERFARLALATVYGQDIEISGPVYDSMRVEGGAIRIHFRPNTAQALFALGGGAVQGFEIAGEDGRFVWAVTEIDGSDVVVSSPEVGSPSSVRYAWADSAKWANLFNDSLLAAAPFSTDHSPIIGQ